MANTFNTGVYPQEWATKLQERLDKPVNWMDYCDVIYTNTQVLNLPYMSTEFTVQTGTRGTAYGFSDFALTNDTITITTKKLVPVYIDRADLAQCTLVSQMEVADRQGQLLKEQIETSWLADNGEWTDVGDDGTGDLAQSSTTAFTITAQTINLLVRRIRQFVIANNAINLMNQHGLGFVWRPQDFAALEGFAQANGYNLADLALKSGIENGYFIMGAYHYVSNSNATGHILAGVRKIQKIGILRSTWGAITITQDPNLQSGIGVIARADFDVMTPNGLATSQFDVNVA